MNGGGYMFMKKAGTIRIKGVVSGIALQLLLFLGLVSVAVAGSSLSLMDAVTYAISKQPNVALAQEDLAYKQAQVRIERGEQDVTLTAKTSLDQNKEPMTPYSQSIYEKSEEDTQTLSTTLTAQKQLNNGITLKSSVGLDREKDNILTSPPDNYAVVSFEVLVPVLEIWSLGFRGKEQKNAEIDYKAGIKDLAFVVSDSAQAAAEAFWEALAARKILWVSQAALSNAEAFLNQMEILVEKDEYPAANLDRIRADVDAKAVSLISSEQSYFSALQSLALAMGSERETLEQFPDVDGVFPQIEKTELDVGGLIAYAEAHRPDLAAERIRESYYKELMDDAKRDSLPDIDLSLSAGYNGLDETSSSWGYIGSLKENVPGISYTIGLSYTRILGNNVSEGHWQQARIMLRKNQIQIQSLQRSIASQVLTAHRNHTSCAKALERQQDAVNKYRSALDKETIRFRHRMSTLSDQLDAMDNYHQSLALLIERQKAYADALVNLRQACGNLITADGSRFEVSEKALMSPAMTMNLN